MHLHLAAAPRVVFADGSGRALAALDGALLAWLALEGPTPRARLAALLWPASDAEAARNALRQRLFQLRRQVGADLVGGSATLALVDGVTHDLDDADSVLADVGEAYAGEYAEWLERQCSRRRQRVRQSLVELAEMAENARDWDDALVHAGELLALEPLSEEAHRRVMRLHYLRGDRAAALLAFDLCERRLKDEVGTRPSAETLALLDALEAGAASTAARQSPATLLRPPRLIGRDAQWTALIEAAAAGRVALLEGEAGMGKTRLVGDFALRDPGASLMVTARPGDAAVPYASLVRLARAALPRAGVLPASVQRPLARLLPEFGEAPGGDDDAQAARLQAALDALLAAAARGGVRHVIVDDLHFCDAASGEALMRLAAGGAGPAWILAVRPAEWPVSARGAALALQHAGGAETIVLPPLSPAQIAELVDSLALPGFDGAALASRLAQHTGGNPMFVLETLKSMRATTAPRDGLLPAAASVTQLIATRIGRLSPEAVKLARCAAVAGQDFSSELATELLGARPLDLADAWAELEAAHVLREQAFAHDLIHEAALASVPPPLARQLRGQVARYLTAHGGAPERIAAHWLASAQPRQAVPHLIEAGRRAARALRKDEATAALLQAAELLERAGDRAGAFTVLEQYFQEVSPVWDDTSRPLIERARGLADTPLERARIGVHHAHLLLRSGDFAGSSAVADEALRLVGPAESPVVVARLMGYAASARLQVGDAPGAVQFVSRAVAVAETSGDEDCLAGLVANLGGILEWAGRPVDAHPHHARALEIRKRGIGSPEELIASALNCATNRMELGWPAEARPLFELAERTATSHDIDLEVELPPLLVHRARLMLDLGEYTRALRRFEEALPVVERRMPPALLGLEATFATLWMRLGQWARARQLARQALARADGAIPLYAARARQVAAEVDAAMGQGDAVLAALDEAQRVLGNGGLRVGRQIALARSQWLPGDEGLEVARRVRAQAAESGVPGLMLAADVRAAQAALRCGDASAARGHVEAALELFGQSVEPYGLYRAEVWRVAVEAVPERARGLLETALHWVRETAEKRVPAEFRDGFLERNAVNRELLALGARAGVSTAGRA